MATLVSVKELMSFIKDKDSKYVKLINSCTGEEFYSNFYFYFPYEMKEADVTLIEFEPGCIILYVL